METGNENEKNINEEINAVEEETVNDDNKLIEAEVVYEENSDKKKKEKRKYFVNKSSEKSNLLSKNFKYIILFVLGFVFA